VIARGKSDHAPFPFVWAELQEPVRCTAQLERASGLQAFGLEPDPDAADLAFDQWRASDEPGNALASREDIFARDG
jgi:hypothetical protein